MAKEKMQIGAEGIYDARQLGIPRMLILGFQHMFAMFGATVLVPLLTGLDVATTLLCAGLGTLLFHLITGMKVPAFLGSSFAFLGGYENGSEIPVSQCWRSDPLYSLVADGVSLSSAFAPGSAVPHMFCATASSADGEVEVEVGDGFGNTWKQTVVRPKAFAWDMQ